MLTGGEAKKVSAGSADRGKRPTIGLVLTTLDEPYQSSVWPGVADVAEERDVNLLCFAGEVLRSQYGFEAQGNRLYDLVSAETVDGLIFMAGSLGNVVGSAGLVEFCRRYRPLPMASIALDLEGIPSVLVDNYEGMRDVLTHLVDVHGYSRIVFVRGPAGHSEADERYRAYLDVLAEHGLPFDPALVVQGDFREEAGVEAVRALLDQRKTEAQAIVAADDIMALGLLRALQSRGVRVPYDVAVAGFDDIGDARFTTPPLTTVRQPLYLQGRRAAEIVLAQLQGEEYPRQEVLPMELIVRQSCGCSPEELSGVVVGEVKESGRPLGDMEDRDHAQALAEMMGLAAASLRGRKAAPDPLWAERLLEAFIAEIDEIDGGVGGFVPVLDDVLRSVAQAGGDVSLWQAVLSALRRQLRPYLAGQDLSRAEDLLQQGRVLIGEVAQRSQAQLRLRSEQQAQALRQFGATLSTTVDMDELMDVIAQGVPRLGIRRGYIALYEGEGLLDRLRMVLAYGEQGRIPLEAAGDPYPAKKLVPAGLWPHDGRYTMAVTALFFRDSSIGVAIFEMGLRQGVVYTALQRQISSALRGTLLFRERERLVAHLESRAVQLQTAAEVAAAASSILDPDTLMQRVVDLVGERFGLYYAGLFLVDSTGTGAVMRAGSGEAGRQMVAQQQRLQIGGHSMIGWCMANRRPRIAPDVHADPMYLAVPLLPRTRSEVALPLKIGDRVIGALDVQSEQVDAFSEDKVTVFQTMADQLAVAIENARIVAEMRGLNEDLRRTLETQARLTETIQALSTPVVPLMRGILLLPLVGNIDSGRSQQVIDQLLAGIQRHRAQVAIVDITGVPVVDTSVANSLVRAAQAVNLLGSEVVLVGIRPEVAQTMVTLGVNLSSMVTHSSLQNGIEYALRRIGLCIAPR
jgi:DNA-binding LacI/PurR family transcriptional regulator/anti-anti-sigma regulatory factor/putative methionine-R-sulfoxide reductase with GAF domain